MEVVTLTNVLAAGATVVWGVMGYLAWYGRYWWWDNLAHLLAGVSLGGFATAHPFPVVRPLVVAAVAVLIWESFEFAWGIWPWVEHTGLAKKWNDTLLDSYLVLNGAVFMGLLVYAQDLATTLPEVL
jgi:hypothetical protein